jgi:hypothetical protein
MNIKKLLFLCMSLCFLANSTVNKAANLWPAGITSTKDKVAISMILLAGCCLVASGLHAIFCPHANAGSQMLEPKDDQEGDWIHFPPTLDRTVVRTSITDDMFLDDYEYEYQPNPYITVIA